jgi:hypothetical protein
VEAPRGEKLNDIREVLIRRLENKGVQPELIPGFVKSVGYAVSENQETDLREINERLHLQGWDDFEVDYHTLQLIIANIETENFRVFDAAGQESSK